MSTGLMERPAVLEGADGGAPSHGPSCAGPGGCSGASGASSCWGWILLTLAVPATGCWRAVAVNNHRRRGRRF